MFGVATLYKYFSLVALIISFFLLGFLLIGGASTESAYSSIYLIKMKYNSTSIGTSVLSNNTVASSISIRANYLTLCASTAGDISCTTNKNTTSLESTISSVGIGSGSVNLVTISTALSSVCKPYILIVTIALILIMTIVVLWQMMPFVPGKFAARKFCAGSALMTSLLWGLGAMLQHQAIVSAKAFVEAATGNLVQVERGSKAEALSWTAFSFLVLTFLASSFRVFRDHRQTQTVDEKC